MNMNVNVSKYFAIPDVKEFFNLLEKVTYLTEEQKNRISDSIIRNVCEKIEEKVDLKNAPHDYDGIHDDLFTEYCAMAMVGCSVLQSDYFGVLWAHFFRDVKGLSDDD